ncbi:hypothetical protein [Brevinema andersonii]|uniref:hypothetical protein n=1 Tax=Brevinema andersonii TaxID=34097 RepID=UPI000B837F03|nr:hypothetical protein [Brevinema andersonii]
MPAGTRQPPHQPAERRQSPILEEYENTVSCNFWSAGDVKTLIERWEEKELRNETVRRETKQKRREGRG